MKCSFCGAVLRDMDAPCPNCGLLPLPGAEPEAEPTPEGAPAPDPFAAYDDPAAMSAAQRASQPAPRPAEALPPRPDAPSRLVADARLLTPSGGAPEDPAARTAAASRRARIRRSAGGAAVGADASGAAEPSSQTNAAAATTAPTADALSSEPRAGTDAVGNPAAYDVPMGQMSGRTSPITGTVPPLAGVSGEAYSGRSPVVPMQPAEPPVAGFAATGADAVGNSAAHAAPMGQMSGRMPPITGAVPPLAGVSGEAYSGRTPVVPMQPADPPVAGFAATGANAFGNSAAHAAPKAHGAQSIRRLQAAKNGAAAQPGDASPDDSVGDDAPTLDAGSMYGYREENPLMQRLASFPHYLRALLRAPGGTVTRSCMQRDWLSPLVLLGLCFVMFALSAILPATLGLRLRTSYAGRAILPEVLRTLVISLTYGRYIGALLLWATVATAGTMIYLCYVRGLAASLPLLCNSLAFLLLPVGALSLPMLAFGVNSAIGVGAVLLLMSVGSAGMQLAFLHIAPLQGGKDRLPAECLCSAACVTTALTLALLMV